jgi:UDP-glucose:(heptosyl)LPS alpha-1,3-glucosyltransferase
MRQIDDHSITCADPDRYPRPQVALAIFSYFTHGGLQRDCLQIGLALQQRGIDAEIVTGRLTSAAPDGIPLTVLGASGVTNHGRDHDFSMRFAIQRRLRYYDLVVGFDAMPNVDVYFAGQAPHGDRLASRRGIWRLLPRYRARVALETAVASGGGRTHILALTGNIVNALRSYYGTPEDRFTLIAPTVGAEFREPRDRQADRQSVQAEFGIRSDAPIVAFVGSRFNTKGLDRALRAFARARSQAPAGTTLVVIGADDPKPWQPLIERLGIARDLRIVGGRDDIARLMTAADLLLHPAREEATGGVLIEAMASGLPILCTAKCGYAPLVQQADAGQVLPEPFTQEALDAALTAILSTPRRETWSANGRRYVAEHVPKGWRQDAVDLIERMARERFARRPLLRPQGLGPRGFARRQVA